MNDFGNRRRDVPRNDELDVASALRHADAVASPRDGIDRVADGRVRFRAVLIA